MKDLASRLRTARKRAGLRLCDLDAKAKLAGGHTAAIENRRRIDPSGQTILALADALGVSTDWLLRGRESGANLLAARTGSD